MELAELTAEMKKRHASKDYKGALNYLFGEKRKEVSGGFSWELGATNSQALIDGRVGDEKKEQLLEFLSVYRDCIAKDDPSKTEGKTQSRLEALDAIKEMIGDTKVAQVTTPAGAVTSSRYFFDLALRVREPKLISQGNSLWCCFDSVLTAFARSNPREYVDYALGLMDRKTGTFRNKPVKCIASGPKEWNSREVTAVDYLTIGSLVIAFNEKAGWYARGRWNWDLGLTDPQLKMLLEQYYTGAEVRSATGKNEWQFTEQKVQWLKEAENKSIMVLLVNGPFIQAMRDNTIFDNATAQGQIDPRKGPSAAQNSVRGNVTLGGQHTRHAVMLANLKVTGAGKMAEADFKIYTWGVGLRVSVKLDKLCQFCRGIAWANA